MERKNQRCPYCGKSMGYFSAYFCRRKAEYVCPKCGKESCVVISKLIIPIFIIAAGISLAVMGIWFFFQLLSNPLGILLVAAPLIIFFILSPKFVRLEPLKKYRKSMEARKAGIEYSDNLTALDFDEESSSLENSMQFKINSDLFNQIKSSRSSSKEQAESKEIVSNSKPIEPVEPQKPAEKDSYVPVIPNVSSEHGSTGSYPLKKIHSEGSKVARQAPAEQPAAEKAKPADEAQPAEAPAPDKDQPKEKKQDTNRYSGNRRF